MASVLLFFVAQLTPQTAELVVQIGHSDFINTVAFSRDGRLIATGSDDTTIKLWDAMTGQEIRTLVGHTGQLRTVAFSPASDLLASADSSGQIIFWDILTGKQKWAIADGGFNAAFSSGGRMIAAGSGRGGIKIWSVATHARIRTLYHRGAASVSTVAFSPNGRLFASGSYQGSIMVWNVNTGKKTCDMSVKGSSTMLKQVLFQPVGESLFSISWDGIVREWDVTKCSEMRQFAQHKVSINWLAFTPDGQTLAIASNPLPDLPSEMAEGVNETIGLWDVKTGESGLPLERDDGSIRSVAFSPDGKILAGVGSKRSVTLWDVSTGHIRRNIVPHSAAVQSLSFSHDGRLLASGIGGITASGGDDRSIKIWSVEGGGELRSFGTRSNNLGSIAFSRDDGTLVMGGRGSWLEPDPEDSRIELWDVASGVYRTIDPGRYGSVHDIKFSDDGKKIAGASFSEVYLWRGDGSVEPIILDGHTGPVTTVAFSPDSTVLASAGSDSTTVLWDAETGSKLNTLRGHTSWVDTVVFSPDGKTLATGSEKSDGTIGLWDVQTGVQKRSIDMRSWVRSVAFSPDGHMLAGAGNDRTVRFFDAATGDPLRTLRGHSSSISSISFDPTGRFMASGSADGTIKIWNVTDGRELCTLIAYDKNDWVVTTPKGRFDTSKDLGNIQGLHWIVSNDPLTPKPLELFMRQYYEPRLLLRTLKCSQELDVDGTDTCDKEFRKLPAIAKINRVQPRVSKPGVAGPN